jgi:hypothetical protein
VKKAPNVAAKGRFPTACSPTAMPVMHCSAMKASMNRSGASLWNSSV